MPIKQFSDYNKVQAFDGDFETLTLGGHVCVIKGTKIESYDWGDMLVLALDIDEGEHKGFYQRQYDRRKAEKPDVKWPGTYRQGIPKDDGSDKDNKTKGFFKGMITCIEKSNPGYVWNWDEKTLAGKKVGGIFGQEEFEAQDGTVRLATKCFYLRSIDSIRKGVTVPQIKKLKNEKPITNTAGVPFPDDDTSLPFDL
jgi:hypothetical protein